MGNRGLPRGLPNITRGVRAVIRDVARRLPEFAHVRASRILVVAGEARRASRATIRPLRFATPHLGTSITGRRKKPVVRFQGRRILYVITLRPMFFRASTPEQRVETVLHELFHISKRFDGTLHAGRRHTRLKNRFPKRLRPLVRRYLAVIPNDHLELLSHDGPAWARQWLERPTSSTRAGDAQGRLRTGSQRVYDERQLFLGPVVMITRR